MRLVVMSRKKERTQKTLNTEHIIMWKVKHCPYKYCVYEAGKPKL